MTMSLIHSHLVHEALRQINIQMIDSSNLYDGLETLWLGSADESLSNQQVRFERFPAELCDQWFIL